MTAGRRKKILRCAQDDRGKAPKMTMGDVLRMTEGKIQEDRGKARNNRRAETGMAGGL